METAKLEGLPIADATEGIWLCVQKRDIREVGRKNPDKCAAACAIHREFHAEARVHLSRVYIKAEGGERWARYELPNNLRAEIVAFDRGGQFDPGDFYLRPIRRSHRVGGTARGGKNKKATGTGRPRAPARETPNVRVRAPLTH